MVSCRLDLFLHSLFVTAIGAPVADDEMGSWIWRSSCAATIAVDQPPSNGRLAAFLPVAASARDPATDDGNHGKSIHNVPAAADNAGEGVIGIHGGNRRVPIGASEAELRGNGMSE